MCGVAGILKLGERRIDPDWIEAMCRVQAHRGPDDAGYAFFRHGEGQRREGGYWVEFTDAEFAHLNEHLPAIQGDYARHELPRYDFDLALGHRRLSILDLTHYGHQPMANSDRRLWVVLNGEIYNFPQLRSDLEAKGHVFRTRSDTEVLLHLWEDQGPDCLAALDGMFGIAVYDRTAGRLYLARDRFGVKPMYWARTDDFLVFASEPKGILASGRIEPRIDPGSLAEYMTFQNLYGERILFEGIHLLPPGEVLEVDVGTVSPTLRRHRYQPGFPSGGAAPTDMDTAAAEVADAFESAVRRQLISDVPVGSYLSGGMDSGSIVAVAGREFPRLLTFTGGFDLTNVSGIEQGFDERPMAERLSHLLQTEHYDVVLHAGDMPAAMERLAWHMDDPRLGMCHQNWYVAKLASKFVKVCLAGAGGDELFGGYPWRYRQGLRAADEAAFDEACFEHWHRLLPGDELPGIFTGELQPHLARPRETFDALMAGLPPADPKAPLSERLLNRNLHFEFQTFMHGFLLVEDRMSMAHGMESRVPFLDNALAELAWRLPPQLKVGVDTLRGNPTEHLETAEGKLVLRRAMERLLPAEFTQQRKQGFSPPDENWYRGPSMGYVKEILLDPRTRERPWFDADRVAATLDEHFQGRRNHRLLIWSLLSVEWLQRHFIDAPQAA